MSELAERDRLRKQSWAAPGGVHDVVVGLMKIALPAMIGILMAYLAMAPLARNQDISFILDKNKVEVSRERMRVQSAQYRGMDENGRPFRLVARSAVQTTSQDPIVNILGMSAEILLSDGPAALKADRGQYNIETEKVAVIGPILFTGPDNYRLETRDVTADLNGRTMESHGAVAGTMPLGRFTASKLNADLDDRRVVLSGGARLHIVQGGLK